MSEILFGPAGRGESFEEMGFKKIADIPEYLSRFGLRAFEYQCGRGVRVNADTMEALRQKGEQAKITFSLHAPYYISMSSMEEEKRLNSIEYILQSARALRMLGGKRIIFHSGSCGKQTREQALEKAVDTMQKIVKAMDENGFGDMTLCPETMGKVNQLGTLEEVMVLCSVDKRIVPCIDFGHLNARTMGALDSKAAFAAVLDTMAASLGDERAKSFHSHFSKIEYTSGGEKQHLTFADTVYGPDYEPLLQLCRERALTPTIICESAGTQAEDAKTMQDYYGSI